MATVEPPPLPNFLSQLHLLVFFFLLLLFIYDPLKAISVDQMHMRTSDLSVLSPKWEMPDTATPTRVRKHQGKGGGKTVRTRSCLVMSSGHKGFCTQELTSALVAHTRPTQTTFQHGEGGSGKGSTKSIKETLLLSSCLTSLYLKFFHPFVLLLTEEANHWTTTHSPGEPSHGLAL